MTDIDGQSPVALVTGGASGIGAGTVHLLADHGMRVISTDVATEQGQDVADAAGARFVHHDVSDQAAWAEVADVVRQHYGRLDVLVNNAGIVGSNPIGEFDLEAWQRTIGVNLTGTALGCHSAIELMTQNPEGPTGAIVNIASTTSLAGTPGDVGYVASKGGVRSLTRSVAVYCSRRGLNIRCNSVIPGAVDTGIIQAAAEHRPGLRDHLDSIALLGRMGTPNDIAKAVLYLATDQSSFVTGSELLVDGGAFAVHPGY
jgi:3(or 17)beta-hydroxysteroid dehydrogenase